MPKSRSPIRATGVDLGKIMQDNSKVKIPYKHKAPAGEGGRFGTLVLFASGSIVELTVFNNVDMSMDNLFSNILVCAF